MMRMERSIVPAEVPFNVISRGQRARCVRERAVSPPSPLPPRHALTFSRSCRAIPYAEAEMKKERENEAAENLICSNCTLGTRHCVHVCDRRLLYSLLRHSQAEITGLQRRFP